MTKTGVVVINFGEPDEPTPDKVQPFLERIFLQNAGLEPNESAVERARSLARERTPGLVEEYRLIGGSPLNAQAVAQAKALEGELVRRGWDARCYPAFQFTRPSIEDALTEARADGVTRLIILPVYPLCGRSTTVAALEDVRAALAASSWRPEYFGLSGWHHATRYRKLRSSGILDFANLEGIELRAPDTLLYFSVHGTPVKYLDEGNRYDRYVDEQCRDIARRVGVAKYAVGFQNHTNRRVAWTQPDNEDRIRAADEKRLVVVPISFMHEQSETLAELDHELRGFVESLGKAFHRVPVPYASPDFVTLLADLVADLVGGRSSLSRCRCAALDGVWCTNGNRELPPSPFVRPTAGVGGEVHAAGV